MTPDLSLLYRLHKDREDFLNEERSLTLRMLARLRWVASASCPDHKLKCPRCAKLAAEWHSGKGEPSEVLRAQLMNQALLEAQEPLHRHKLSVERQMTAVAKELPVADFVKDVTGLGWIGVGQIVAEAGDLSNYANPAKLWKRMGLAVMNGRAQRRVKDKEEAQEQGFNPRRRAVMFVIGDSLIKKHNRYRELYLERKTVEEEKHPDLTRMHRHRRAQRYMEKRLLRDLWTEWGRA
jgi:hypothetical protein